MSIQFLPASGSTIAFGSVAIGTSSPFVITATQRGANSYYQLDSGPTFTGPQAAMFGGTPIGALGGPYYGPDSGSGTIAFRPTAGGAATATLTWTYELGQNGVPNGQVLTGFYNLTGTGASNPIPDTEAAALLQSFRYLLVPSIGTSGKVLSFYDTQIFDDPIDDSVYLYKAEDITPDRVPTVRNVIITYIDLGVATLAVSVSGINDQGAVVTESTTVTIGTVGATGNLLTAFAYLSVTGFRPQVRLTRTAGEGPIAISHVMATGQIETQVTL